MWLFKVVAPEKEREQNPHLNNFSLVCVSTWLLSSDGVPYESVHWPHWYGLSGVWEHSCIWRRTRWVKVFKHCRHLHIPNSSGDREIPDMFVPKCSWYCGVWRSGGIAGRSAGITLFTPSPFRLRACPSFVRGEFLWSSGKVTVGRFYLKYQINKRHANTLTHGKLRSGLTRFKIWLLEKALVLWKTYFFYASKAS